MRGTKAKISRRKAIAGAQHNANAAEFFFKMFRHSTWQLFWANVEIAALMTYHEHRTCEEDKLTGGVTASVNRAALEKSLDCWPASVEI
jgi:hypothetical protein